MPETVAAKRVADYCGIDIFAVGDICYFDFLLLLRDAVIFMNNQTAEGREYLKKCWLLEQTEPDRKRLREIRDKQ